ncbi:hypothetical protein QBC47DRAFT_401376 [Echria macrotheca]|uniref:C6 transcription factor n=1 Tax=Echria macrotheca TaxID=438768 RepID=A0AAJ0BDU8_9PEZI|nr:hypothetical protein QBC47DRAFT_401376 [Echria macrotheca]
MVSTRSSSAALMTPRTGRSSSPPAPPLSTSVLTKSRTRAAAAAGPTSAPAASSVGWYHAPSKFAVYWLAASIPLIFWDAGYVFLRPHSMVGGSLHWPIWSLYKIQAELDHTYGFKEFLAGGGWNYAQSAGNIVENLANMFYLALYWRAGTALRTASGETVTALTGRTGAVALLVAFATAVSTTYKTALYWAIEAFSGFDNIGHNPPLQMASWIILNGAWLVFPAYLAYSFGAEIVDGLTRSSSSGTSKRSHKAE